MPAFFFLAVNQAKYGIIWIYKTMEKEQNGYFCTMALNDQA